MYAPSAIGIVTVFTPDVNLGVDAIAGLSNVALCHSLSMFEERHDGARRHGDVAGLKLFPFSVIVGPVGAAMLPGREGVREAGRGEEGRIGERAEERDERVPLGGGETEALRSAVGSAEPRIEPRAVLDPRVVEGDHLVERGEAAVVHEARPHGDVAQRRRLEHAAADTRVDRRRVEAVVVRCVADLRERRVARAASRLAKDALAVDLLRRERGRRRFATPFASNARS